MAGASLWNEGDGKGLWLQRDGGWLVGFFFFRLFSVVNMSGA